MTVLAFGGFLDERVSAIRRTLEERGGGAVFVQDPRTLVEVLRSTSTKCIVLESPSRIREVARLLREAKGHGSIPVLALIHRASPRLLIELHAAGATDVVLSEDTEGLRRRLESIPNFDAVARPTLFKGTCVLAHADAQRRAQVAEVLEQAGFEVLCASSTADALAAVRGSIPVALVVSNTLPPEGGRRALRTLSEQGGGAIPAVLLSSGSPAAFSPQGWAIVGEEAPADDLLFMVNDLLRPPDQVDARSSRRILCATLCNFRAAGECDARPGLTYNIGRDGMFVRTLDAPRLGSEVWLELAPPGLSTVIHVRGEVAWTMALGQGSRGASPIGFGVHLEAKRSPRDDLETFRTRYQWMLRVATAVGV